MTARRGERRRRATIEDLDEAKRQILSIIAKCEAAQRKLSRPPGSPSKHAPQLTLLARRLAAFALAMSLIEREREARQVSRVRTKKRTRTKR